MRQILSQREVRADRWRYPEEAGEGPVVRTLAELLALPGPAGGAGETGDELAARVGATDDVGLLAPFIGRLKLLVVLFDASGDGRGFTQAQLLRQRHGYTGELRAAGAVKRDHLYLLARCGFDSFDFAAGEDPRAALEHMDRYSVAYQAASGRLVQPRLRA
ncbi:MAG: DUF934 domain-containing protein [Steroidobacteraceae bacterium]